MKATVQLTNETCLLCETREDTVQTQIKDAKFAGVLFVTHLVQILRKKQKKEELKDK